MMYVRLWLVVGAVVALAVLWFQHGRDGVRLDAAAALSVQGRTPARGYVMVEGAVRHPGIYECGVNVMADAVIKMAGLSRGFRRYAPDGADRRLVVPGDLLHVELGREGEGRVVFGHMPAVARLAVGQPLDINRMDDNDFKQLPGVGPALAARIVQFRQNNGGIMAVNDLAHVEGIGEKRFRQLQKYF